MQAAEQPCRHQHCRRQCRHGTQHRKIRPDGFQHRRRIFFDQSEHKHIKRFVVHAVIKHIAHRQRGKQRQHRQQAVAVGPVNGCGQFAAEQSQQGNQHKSRYGQRNHFDVEQQPFEPHRRQIGAKLLPQRLIGMAVKPNARRQIRPRPAAKTTAIRLSVS